MRYLPSQSLAFDGIQSGQCDIIEYAEPVGVLRLGMMARRSNDTDSLLVIAVEDVIDDLKRRSNSQRGAFESGRMQVNRVELPAHFAQILLHVRRLSDEAHVLPTVRQTQFLRGRFAGINLMQTLNEIVVGECFFDLRDSFRSLIVPGEWKGKRKVSLRASGNRMVFTLRIHSCAQSFAYRTRSKRVLVRTSDSS